MDSLLVSDGQVCHFLSLFAKVDKKEKVAKIHFEKDSVSVIFSVQHLNLTLKLKIGIRETHNSRKPMTYFYHIFESLLGVSLFSSKKATWSNAILLYLFCVYVTGILMSIEWKVLLPF